MAKTWFLVRDKAPAVTTTLLDVVGVVAEEEVAGKSEPLLPESPPELLSLPPVDPLELAVAPVGSTAGAPIVVVVVAATWVVSGVAVLAEAVLTDTAVTAFLVDTWTRVSAPVKGRPEPYGRGNDDVLL